MLFLLRRTDLNPGSGSKVLRRTKTSTRVKARGLVSDVTPPGIALCLTGHHDMLIRFDLTKILPHFHSTLLTTTVYAVSYSILHQEHVESEHDNIVPDDVIEEMVREKIEKYNLTKVLGIHNDIDGSSPLANK